MFDQKEIESFRKVIAKAFPYKEEMVQRGVTQDDLDTLREMSLSSSVIPTGLIDFFFYIFFVGKNKNFDATVNLLQNYFQLVKEAPGFFDHRDVESKEVIKSLENQYYIILPPTPNNNNLIFHHMANDEPKNYVFDDVTRTILMVIELCLHNFGPRDGFVVIIDMKGARMGHLFQASISFIRKGIRLLEEACPIKIKEIHILNTVPFLDIILSIVKPFMKSDILNRVLFHQADMDYEQFYKEFVPKSCLPSNYGGDLESVEELHLKNCKELKKVQNLFYHEGKMMRYEYEGADIDGNFQINTRM